MALKLIFIIIAVALVSGETPSLSKELSLALEPSSDSLIIPDSVIINGSVVVRKNGILLDKEEWRFTDTPVNMIKFINIRNNVETLAVSYRVPSLHVGKTVWKRKIELIPESADSAVIKNSVNIEIPLQEESAGLTVGGSKTLGVTVGSGGALAVNQTLDLSVYGEIAKGIEVRARLADQNLPFRSEGSTESIREIDKILIEVRSGRRGLTLGDMVFADNRSRFASYEKKIKGIKGESRGSSYSADAGVALSDGKFHSYIFQGEEGRQGPYIIVDAEGRSAPVVLSGTERVFINGRLKVRGEGNDYTMDYTSGRLTFTPRCLITADDRIMVEFEYMDSEYQKSIIAASGRADFFDKKLSLTFSGLRESDDYSSPAAGELSEEELTSLRNAGDSAAADGRGARIITRDSVALYRGFYTIESSDSHYVYHPPKDTTLFRNRILYDVSFLYTG
ncbi:MAG: hypothetical protein JNL74_16205, partial [Fibrobacteres bacterium]|nr:hypothetical protein [Fibrobacterota bacterium]